MIRNVMAQLSMVLLLFGSEKTQQVRSAIGLADSLHPC